MAQVNREQNLAERSPEMAGVEGFTSASGSGDQRHRAARRPADFRRSEKLSRASQPQSPERGRAQGLPPVATVPCPANSSPPQSTKRRSAAPPLKGQRARSAD